MDENNSARFCFAGLKSAAVNLNVSYNRAIYSLIKLNRTDLEDSLDCVRIKSNKTELIDDLKTFLINTDTEKLKTSRCNSYAQLNIKSQ